MGEFDKCSCGSQKNHYKCCFRIPENHKNLSDEDINNITRLLDKIYANVDKNTVCKFPGCTALAINSHTLSKNSILKPISSQYNPDETNLIIQKMNIYGEYTFFEESIEKASTYRLFCKYHNSFLFNKLLDQTNYDQDKDNQKLFLSAYRSLCGRLGLIERNLSIFNHQQFNEIYKILNLQKINTNNTHSLIQDITRQKEYMEGYFNTVEISKKNNETIYKLDILKNDFIHLRYALEKTPDLIVSSIEKTQLVENSDIYCLNTVQTSRGWELVITLFPLNSRFNNGVIELLKFFNQYDWIGEVGNKFFTKSILEDHENIFINKQWLHSLPAEGRKLIKKYSEFTILSEHLQIEQTQVDDLKKLTSYGMTIKKQISSGESISEIIETYNIHAHEVYSIFYDHIHKKISKHNKLEKYKKENIACYVTESFNDLCSKNILTKIITNILKNKWNENDPNFHKSIYLSKYWMKMKANGYLKIKSDKNTFILTNPTTQHKISLYLISYEEFNLKSDVEELLKKYKDKIDSHDIVIVDISNRINIFRKIKITLLRKK